MLFFHDAEFNEDGRTIDLISYAILADNGDHLYLINQDADWCRISERPWLVENVLPHLPGEWLPCGQPREHDRECWRPLTDDPRVQQVEVIASRVQQFVASFGLDRNMHELWAWYGAYDHVALAQLFGPMMDLPRCIPMHTNDLKTLVGRDRVPDELRATDEHDALADCRFDQRLYHWATARRGQRSSEALRRAVENSEEARRVRGLTIAWQGLNDQQREDARRAMRGLTVWRLLDELAGIYTP